MFVPKRIELRQWLFFYSASGSLLRARPAALRPFESARTLPPGDVPDSAESAGRARWPG